MKKSEVKVGGVYTAKVNNRLVEVRIDSIKKASLSGRDHYDCTNLTTRRKVIIKSPAKFRKEVTPVRPFSSATPDSQTKSGQLGSDSVAETNYHEEQVNEDTEGEQSLPPSMQARSSGATTVVVQPTMQIVVPTAVATVLPKGGQHSPPPTDTSYAPLVSTNSLAAKLATARQEERKTLPPHMIVEARAGTGKTTTLIEGLKLVMGLHSSLVPSSQQKAVWESMCLSRGQVRTVCFCAFNNSIAKELSERIPKLPGVAAKTLHGLGLYAIRKSFQLLPGDAGINSGRVDNIICRLTNTELRALRKDAPGLIKGVKELVGYCKQNLVWGEPHELDHFRKHFDLEIADQLKDRVYELVPRVLEECKKVAEDRCVDFNDMIWIPVVLKLPVFVNDMLLVDESQDLNRCQQALAKMVGRRLIFCGDPFQSLYGFAGADVESMKRLETELKETERGCVNLPLTVTRRCGKAIVEQAKQYVPDFEAFETNPQGEIKYASYPTVKRNGQTVELPYDQTYLPLVQEGDFILCRANAPLVAQCLRFIKAGRRAQVQGKDVGTGLIDLVETMEAQSLPDLVSRLSDWLIQSVEKEMALRQPSETKIANLQDRYDCLKCFIDVSSSVQDVIFRIKSIFTDEKGTPGIKLSSVHKSKGLEAKRVFILEGFGRPEDKIKNQWERDAERFIRYVAITRSRETLVFVS